MKSTVVLNAVTLTASAQTGGGIRSVDLFARSPIPELVGIEIDIATNGTAPGTPKTMTVHYAFSGTPDLTADQLAEADSVQVFNVPNAANTQRVMTLPTLTVAQRYLYLWFDNDVLSGGATLTVRPKISL